MALCRIPRRFLSTSLRLNAADKGKVNRSVRCPVHVFEIQPLHTEPPKDGAGGDVSRKGAQRKEDNSGKFGGQSGPLIKSPIPVSGVAGRYAHVLYSAGTKKDVLQDTMTSINELLKTATAAEYSDPRMSREQRAQNFKTIAAKLNVPEVGVNFLMEMARNDRLKLLKRTVELFNQMVISAKGDVACEVTTATQLEECDRFCLQEALQMFFKVDQTVRLTERVDPSILGGMVVKLGEDRHIDMSIRTKLNHYTKLLQIV